jgi:hypothetical protein
MSNQKLQDLIQGLSEDLAPQRQAVSASGFMVRWGVAGGVLVLLMLTFQVRGDLSVRAMEPRFWLESGFWLLSAAIAAALVYRSSIPSLLRKRDQNWGFFALAGVLALLAFRLANSGAMNAELPGEMDLHRGRCGSIILGVGIVAGLGFFAWARQAAPTRQGLTGLWIAVSAGCLGSFAMQFVCEHDNVLHVWIWHVTPVLLLSCAGMALGRRYLRWGGKAA